MRLYLVRNKTFVFQSYKFANENFLQTKNNNNKIGKQFIHYYFII